MSHRSCGIFCLSCQKRSTSSLVAIIHVLKILIGRMKDWWLNNDPDSSIYVERRLSTACRTLATLIFMIQMKRKAAVLCVKWGSVFLWKVSSSGDEFLKLWNVCRLCTVRGTCFLRAIINSSPSDRHRRYISENFTYLERICTSSSFKSLQNQHWILSLNGVRFCLQTVSDE